MMNKFSSVGKIIYDPKRDSMKKNTNWWCVINVDREITRYYRWFIQKKFWGDSAITPNWLCQPSWDAHISVVRGEQPTPEYMPKWKEHHAQKVQFEYFNDIRSIVRNDGDVYWIVSVQAPIIEKIRNDLGLYSEGYTYHLTIGRTWTNSN